MQGVASAHISKVRCLDESGLLMASYHQRVARNTNDGDFKGSKAPGETEMAFGSHY